MLPALLLISWNRRDYVQKTIVRLFNNSEDFQLFWWDNGSSDGVEVLCRETTDPRLVARHLHQSNIGQTDPVRWFLDRTSAKLGGKIDDDILLPDGWLGELAAAFAGQNIGMIGGWPFPKEDWIIPELNTNVEVVGETKVLRCTAIQGHSFLAYTETLRKYFSPPHSHGLPIDRQKMTVDGLISGHVVPPVFCHNMDDPRSPHCLHTKDSIDPTTGALTARKMGFRSVNEFVAFLKADARARQTVPFGKQMTALRLDQDTSKFGRLRRRIYRKFTGV